MRRKCALADLFKASDMTLAKFLAFSQCQTFWNDLDNSMRKQANSISVMSGPA